MLFAALPAWGGRGTGRDLLIVSLGMGVSPWLKDTGGTPRSPLTINSNQFTITSAYDGN